MVNKFETFQKKCIKWIVSEQNIRYYTYSIYIRKCRQVNLLPLAKRFELNDLILFHKVIYNLIPLNLPSYLSFYTGGSRLRSSHLDSLSIVSNIQSRTITNSYLKKSFFYRTHTEWNALPFHLREIHVPSLFKIKVIKYFWIHILQDLDDLGEGDYWSE